MDERKDAQTHARTDGRTWATLNALPHSTNSGGIKIVNIFLPMIFSICFECSKELSHWDCSFEYPQHMFWLRNKKNIFLLHTLNFSPVFWNIKCLFFIIGNLVLNMIHLLVIITQSIPSIIQICLSNDGSMETSWYTGWSEPSKCHVLAHLFNSLHAG